jgi:hypothetical protein
VKVKAGDIVCWVEEGGRLQFGKVREVVEIATKDGETVNVVFLEGHIGYKDESELLTEDDIKRMFETYRRWAKSEEKRG